MDDTERRTAKRSRFDQKEPEKRSSRFDRRSRSPPVAKSDRRSRSPIGRPLGSPATDTPKNGGVDPAAAAGEHEKFSIFWIRLTLS
jgi:hypothetical protein